MESQIRYFTKELLIQANSRAKVIRGRCLRPEKLEELEDELRYPVFHSMLQGDGATVRVTVLLDGQGRAAMLDVETKFFNQLPSIEAPVVH